VLQSGDEVIAFGNEFGWPVAIKAAYGGGGRGMRVVNSPDEAADALASAQSEALKGFGRDECYIERYLTWPRHIEMQVFCDTKGNGVWLGERDCSCQRRHQKLVEESPAANFPDDVRTKMGEAAVAVALACGYVNAGTVEFLYQDGEFYFLEMNTRLQVEHPVTELVTGMDLVELQLLIASGKKLPFSQKQINSKRNGHAIEVRINAEDPAGGRFMPSPGKISTLAVPAGYGVRWDGGYAQGDTISQYYDNLVGKLVVWAPDREQARKRMLRALGEFEIVGVHTTIPAHVALLATDAFASVNHSTKWVEDEVDPASFGGAAAPEAVAADGADEAEPLLERTIPVEVDGKRYSVKLWLPETAAGTASPKRRSARPRPGAGASGGGAGSGTITAPMQGTIVKVLVGEGEEVELGQSVLVLEAMKMENHISAEKAGTVKEVRVAAGDTVGTGDVLVVIE
jgi:acetyl-CoA/propionyl-CoA carboxylase biotin carboxyl carrier protein